MVDALEAAVGLPELVCPRLHRDVYVYASRSVKVFKKHMISLLNNSAAILVTHPSPLSAQTLPDLELTSSLTGWIGFPVSNPL